MAFSVNTCNANLPKIAYLLRGKDRLSGKSGGITWDSPEVAPGFAQNHPKKSQRQFMGGNLWVAPSAGARSGEMTEVLGWIDTAFDGHLVGAHWAANTADLHGGSLCF